jgi:Rrf2 family protein
MKFSKKSEYALRAMVVMSSRQGALQTIPRISAEAGVPSKFLEQILLALRHAGLLQSRRGAGGGYLLEKAPSSIRLIEIIEAVESAVSSPGSPLPKDAVEMFLADISGHIQKRLEETTLEDLVRLAQPTDATHFDI